MADDFAGNITTAGVLQIGGSAGGTFEEASDVDWFAIELVAGQHLEVTGPWWLHGMSFYNSLGGAVPLDFFRAMSGDGQTQTAGFTAATTGTYYVGVTYMGSDASYTLSAQLGDGNHPNNLANLPVINLDTGISGELSPNETDWFSVSVQAGESIQIDTEAAVDLRLYDPFGVEVFNIGPAFVSNERHWTFTATTSGAYYFAARTTMPQSVPVSYQFNAFSYQDNIPDDRLLAVSLDPDGDYREAALNHSRDQDWFRIDLKADTPVSIKVVFDDPSIPQVNLDLTSVSSGLVVATGVGASSAQIAYGASSDGTFDFRVHSPQGFLGSYQVVVTPIGDENSPYSPSSIQIGELAHEAFDYISDADSFLFEGVAGQTLQLELSDRPLGGSRSAPIVRGPDGQVVSLGFASDFSGVFMFTLPTTGTYTLEMRGAKLDTGPQPYAFVMHERSRFATPPALDYLVSSERVHWYHIPDPGPTPMVTPTNGFAFGGPAYDEDGFPIESSFHETLAADVTVFSINGFSPGGFSSFEMMFTNEGTIWVQSETLESAGYRGAIAIGATAWGTITNYGKIVVLASASALGLNSGSDGVLVNHGEIHIVVVDEGILVKALQTFASATGRPDVQTINTGLVSVYSEYSGVTGFFFANEMNVVNSGQMLASGFQGARVLVMGSGGSVVNSGLLIATSAWDVTTLDHQNVFASVAIDSATKLTVTNSGTISGAIALNVGGTLNLQNDKDGTISGAILIHDNGPHFGSTIKNSGVIAGEIIFGGGADLFDTSAGVTYGLVFLGDGNDDATGGAQLDYLIGESGDDNLFGAAGDDILEGGGGDDRLLGGDGFDIASYLGETASVTVSLLLAASQATGIAGMDTLISIEGLEGSFFNDILTGDAGSNLLVGLDGNDILTGGAGDDVLDGGQGNDLLRGESGGNLFIGGAGTDTLLGGAGIDIVSAEDDVSGVTIHLLGGWAQDGWGDYDTLSNLEYVLGSAFSDTLVGNDVANSIVGGGGNDWIVGLAGDDLLEGGDGVNVLIGGDGVDLASYASQTASLWIDMRAGVYSSAGVWDVFFESIEGALGGTGSDTIFGDASANTLRGGAGIDALIGNAGDDVLEGGQGEDWLVGGEGNDRLIGGVNDVDVLTGGAGADTFVLGTNAGWDVAFDFNASQDRFDLGGHTWSGFFTIDADGDGQINDTLLGYAGGNFVALDVSGLTLAQWNALVDDAAAAEHGAMLMANTGAMTAVKAAPSHVADRAPVIHEDVRNLLAGVTSPMPDTPGWDLFG